MTNATGTHSFRRLLNDQTGAYREYVLSDTRYAGLATFVAEQDVYHSKHDAIDIGCGGGVITRGLGSVFNHVTGIDQNPDNVVLAQSLTDEEAARRVTFKHAEATQLPFSDQSLDFALLNGVLEWVGLNDNGEPPGDRQMRVLREVWRVLRPGGHLYVGIENRWHPRSIVRDPHTQLQWVNALPRAWADKLCRSKTGRPFQAYIYGHRALRHMFHRTGFASVQVYVPFPGYQHPVFYVPVHPRRAALRSIGDIDHQKVDEILRVVGRSQDAADGIRHLRWRARLGLLGLLTHDFAFLCTKA